MTSDAISSLRSRTLNITLILPDKARRILFGKKKIIRIRSILPEEIASEVATFQFAQTDSHYRYSNIDINSTNTPQD